jgi:3',5'-cyclic AMP phosphodiesterase CpdA
VTVISGDFVQNGTRDEFEQARDFVAQLPKPRVLVAGNHDLPFLNLLRRFIVGLRLYKEYISDEIEPFWSNGQTAIMGVNTARRWPIRGGRIHETQVTRVEQQLCSLGPGVTKILVTHHPFDLDPRYGRGELVGRARMAMGRLAQSIDMLLAGHMHVSHAGHTAVRYRLKGRSAIFVQAGTATSTRGRGEPNAFNVIRIDRPRLVVEQQQWQSAEQRFYCASRERFELWPEPAVCEIGREPQPEEVETEYACSTEGNPEQS